MATAQSSFDQTMRMLGNYEGRHDAHIMSTLQANVFDSIKIETIRAIIRIDQKMGVKIPEDLSAEQKAGLEALIEAHDYFAGYTAGILAQDISDAEKISEIKALMEEKIKMMRGK
jgi:hypothetical protein